MSDTVHVPFQYLPLFRKANIFTTLYFGTAYFSVHSLAVAMAPFSSSFQCFATSGASGSSGLGAPSRAWIERSMVRICSAGDQLSVLPHGQLLPCVRSCRVSKALTLQHV